jgi:hypothetical protein
MATSLRILFVGCFRYNSGSSHALLGYARAAKRQNYDLRVSSLGVLDQPIREKVRVADRDWTPDLMVLVFESEQFLTVEDIRRIEQAIPRKRRLIIDPDGKFSDTVQAGSDTNHPSANSWTFWNELYQQLSDTILQPCLGPVEPPVRRFLYFGIDANRPQLQQSGNKIFDLIYVGNNWYRWHDFVWLLGKIEQIRSQLGRIAVFGKHWFNDPEPGFEEHTYSDPGFLQRHRVEAYGSVPFDEVELNMGKGKLHPIFVRPVLNKMNLVTPRMFETFGTNTVPILPDYFQHARVLYGPEVAPLYLTENPSKAISAIMDKYPEYQSLTREIGNKLKRKHSYDIRLAELLNYLP